MLKRPDPLLETRQPDRLHYATGVLLDAQAFRDEQTYHRARLARALAYLHGSGTVAGLEVVHEPEIPRNAGDPDHPNGRPEQLGVEPGLAIDPAGRMIEVARSQCLRLGNWFTQQDSDTLASAMHDVDVPDQTALIRGVVVDVYLRFVECPRGKRPAFAAGPFDALDAVVPSKVRDGHTLDIVLRDESTPPEPTSPLPALESLNADEARDALHQALLGAWHGSSDSAAITALHAHAVDQDPTGVFLARVVIEATDPATAGDPPERTTGDPVFVLNLMRPFVYAAGAVGRWLGIT